MERQVSLLPEVPDRVLPDKAVSAAEDQPRLLDAGEGVGPVTTTRPFPPVGGPPLALHVQGVRAAVAPLDAEVSKPACFQNDQAEPPECLENPCQRAEPSDTGLDLRALAWHARHRSRCHCAAGPTCECQCGGTMHQAMQYDSLIPRELWEEVRTKGNRSAGPRLRRPQPLGRRAKRLQLRILFAL